MVICRSYLKCGFSSEGCFHAKPHAYESVHCKYQLCHVENKHAYCRSLRPRDKIILAVKNDY